MIILNGLAPKMKVKPNDITWQTWSSVINSDQSGAYSMYHNWGELFTDKNAVLHVS
jgi:hypothetical protein